MDHGLSCSTIKWTLLMNAAGRRRRSDDRETTTVPCWYSRNQASAMLTVATGDDADARTRRTSTSPHSASSGPEWLHDGWEHTAGARRAGEGANQTVWRCTDVSMPSQCVQPSRFGWQESSASGCAGTQSSRLTAAGSFRFGERSPITQGRETVGSPQ